MGVKLKFNELELLELLSRVLSMDLLIFVVKGKRSVISVIAVVQNFVTLGELM